MIYAPPGAPPATAPQPPAAPATPSVRAASRTFAIVFSILAIVMTAGALVLTTIGGQQYSTAQDIAPSGWNQVYDASLTTADTSWDTTQGCQFSNGGLYAAANAICQFLPSTTQDLTGQGFLLRVTVAPAAQAGNAEPGLASFIDLGNSLFIGVSQMGQYDFCRHLDCNLTLAAAAIDWHTDAYVSNTMAIKYDAQAGQLMLYMNGIQVASVKATIDPSTTIGLSAQPDAEAVFTHATLYSAGANGLTG